MSVHRIPQALWPATRTQSLLLEITDPGMGITRDKLAQIFEPFFTNQVCRDEVGPLAVPNDRRRACRTPELRQRAIKARRSTFNCGVFPSVNNPFCSVPADRCSRMSDWVESKHSANVLRVESGRCALFATKWAAAATT